MFNKAQFILRSELSYFSTQSNELLKNKSDTEKQNNFSTLTFALPVPNDILKLNKVVSLLFNV